MTIVMMLVLAGSVVLAAKPPLDILAQITKDKYPDADVVTVFDSTQIKLEADGSNVREHHLLVRILTDAGKNEYSNYRDDYMATYDKLSIKFARVIGPDGKVTDVLAKDITDVPMPCFEGEPFILPNVHLVTATFHELEVGSAVEVAVEDKTTNPSMDDNFDTYLPFEKNDPIRCRSLSINLPASMKLRWKVYNGTVDVESTAQGARKTIVWSKNDVAKVLPEPQMPPLLDVVTKLLVCTQPDWATWSRWYYHLCEDRLMTDTALDAKITELIKGKTDQDAKIRALYYFVATQIRYVETELSGKKGGYQPEKAALTYQKRYGVCRDKAALLAAMLRKIGVDAYMVLTNPGEKVEKELPVDQFDHAIVAVKKTDGSYYYIDPTIESAREYLSPIEMDKGVLVCDSIGEDLAYTPLEAPDKYMTLVTMSDSLTADGTLLGTMAMAPSGITELGFRMMLKQLPPAMQKTQFENIVHRFGPGAVLDTFTTTDPNDMNTPLTLSLHFTVENFATLSGNEMRFSSSQDGMEMGADAWSLATRKYPVYYGHTWSVKGRQTLVLPSGYYVKSLPDTYNLSTKEMAVRSTHTVMSDRIESSRSYEGTSPLVPLEDYPANRALMQKIEDVSKQQVILTQ
jgi:hypothetical protein